MNSLFDTEKFINDVSRSLLEDGTELPTFNSNYSFAVVNNLGILHLITKNKKIYRKQHLRVTMESIQMTLNIFNDLLPSQAMFKTLLLIDCNAKIDFAYCYKLAETMDRADSEAFLQPTGQTIPIRPVFVASPFCFWYGDFVENTRGKYSDTTINLGGRIRMNSDMANSFEIGPGDEVHVRGHVSLRITGSRRYLHITKTKIDDNIVAYAPANSERKNDFNTWLRIQAYLHGHQSPGSDGEYPMIVNPLIDINFE